MNSSVRKVTPLLVVSCDRYADVWPFFFDLLRIHWSDCPLPVLLGSNHLSPDRTGVESVLIGADRSWSRGVGFMLDRVEELHPGCDFVLLFLEDFFLKSAVDSARIIELIQIARARQVGCLRLAAGLPLALLPAAEVAGLPGIGVIGSAEPYRVTLQASIWRISTLRKLLAPGLTPWEFEQIGTQLSEMLDDQFWGVMAPAINYDHAIEKGKWKPAGLEILTKAGLDPGKLSRAVFSEAQLAQHHEQSGVQSEQAKYRSAALRSFLIGHRRDGLVSICRHIGNSRPSVTDIGLGIVGLLGRTATRTALEFYVKMRLRACARREAAGYGKPGE
jgi:hypothetical protein